MDKNFLQSLTSVRFDSYKSFNQDGPFRIDLGKNITLIIGRNNSGKSSIIDVIDGITKKSSKELPESMIGLCPSVILDEEHMEHGFSVNGYNQYLNNFEINFASRFLGYEFTLQLDENRYIPSSKQKDTRLYLDKNNTKQKPLDNWYKVAQSYSQSFVGTKLRRINAERDIVPEAEDENEDVDENGNGTTNLIRKYINTDGYDEGIVEKKILDELNKIMSPDAYFSAIRVQQVRKAEKYEWEVFLEENGHRYALSKSGSGLKTILLILVNLFIIPETKAYKNKEILYGFEEIENNLHPALQRRVFDYLYDYATKNNCRIIITTHSQIAINAFYGKKEAKLYHVIKSGGISKLTSISENYKKATILDDLGVKASDLLQTNGIIWVEGPSDRIYILKWLQALTDCSCVEGRDYQFLYYGGKLLSHYEAEEQDKQTKGLINILTTNRHAAIIMDSDKKTKQAPIRKTKKRIQEEFERQGLFCWITKGKEIENYIASEAINNTYNSRLSQVGKYEDFPEYISTTEKHFSNNKVDFARAVCEHLTADNSSCILDLRQQIEALSKEISSWNHT